MAFAVVDSQGPGFADQYGRPFDEIFDLNGGLSINENGIRSTINLDVHNCTEEDFAHFYPI